MNNLRRHPAQISEDAWEQIEQEAPRVPKRHLGCTCGSKKMTCIDHLTGI